MKKFIVIYYATADEKKQWENAKPEDMKKGMDAWMAWVEKCGSGVVDMGAPLGNGQKWAHPAVRQAQRMLQGIPFFKQKIWTELLKC